MNCNFELIKPGRWKCSDCGFIAKTEETDASRIYRNCPKSKQFKPCVHIGEKTTTLEGGCESCNGRKIDVDLFACPLQDECTKLIKVGNMPNYRSCSDYTPEV